MAQHTYDEESVQELLGWAKRCLKQRITRQKSIRLMRVLQSLMVNFIWSL